MCVCVCVGCCVAGSVVNEAARCFLVVLVVEGDKTGKVPFIVLPFFTITSSMHIFPIVSHSRKSYTTFYCLQALNIANFS